MMQPQPATNGAAPAQGPLDRLTAVAARLFRAPAATVALFDADGLTLRAGLGMCATALPGTKGFTDHAAMLGPGGVLVVEDAAKDARFRDHPLVAGEAGLRFYAGAVITLSDGRCAGALCVVDQVPREAPGAADLAALSALAETAADILEREAQSRSQGEQLKMLALAEAMSGVGHWRCDLETGKVDWSDEVYRIHGVTRETFDPTLNDALAFYHPDDRAEVRRLVERAGSEGTGYQFELRLTRADGEERIVQSRAASERTEEGRPRAVFGVFQDVTEAHRNLASARKSEARYRLLADNSADVIARVKPDGTSRYISPAIHQLLGWTYEEMSGQSMDYVHPDDRAGVLAIIKSVLAGSPPRSIQHRAVHRNGAVVWVESRFQAIDDGGEKSGEVIVAIRDISERKALEDQLQAALAASQRSEARYRLMTDRAADIIITYTYDTIVTFTSPALERVKGISPEDMVGTSVNRLIHPDDVAEVVGKLKAFIKAHPDQDLTTQKYRALDKDGNVLFYETRTQIVRDEAGRVVEIQDVARDVTETRRLELDLREARDRAEAAARTKSEFLANMSHELRTPLTSIIGFADLLKTSAALPPVERRHVELIATGSEALLSVINDILDYSKLEAQALEMDAGSFDPAALALAVGDLMEAQASGKALAFSVDIADDLPPSLVGDQGRLRQVMLNFLSNAVKFTPSGAVRLKMGGVAGDEGWRLRVEVRDTGIGVDAPKMAAMFDRFTQADQSTTRTYGGTGLGLAISKRLIEAMGGEIGAESILGEGSMFWFEVGLPVCEGVMEADVEAAAATATPVSARVLVADDAPANRELVSAILGHMGMEVETVCNGVEAIEALVRGRHDLVLMDVHMPVMDGLAAARRIRELGGNTARTPILALTANVQAEQVQRCLAAGMDGHLGKPISIAELAREVGRWLGPDRPVRGTRADVAAA